MTVIQEHSSVITPAAPSTFTSPKLGRRSHTTLAWDLGGTAGGLNYSLKDDALSSGAAPLDYAEQVQPYKRRRLASDISFAPEPAYAVAQTTYEATEVPLFPFMVDQPNEMMVQDPAATNGIMQRPSEPDHSASQVWLYMDRLCCAPCLPSWSFYGPSLQSHQLYDAILTRLKHRYPRTLNHGARLKLITARFRPQRRSYRSNMLHHNSPSRWMAGTEIPEPNRNF